MVQLELSIELAYDVLGQDGADFVFNIHAARTACQTVENERLELSQPIAPSLETDPVTGTRFMRVEAQRGSLEARYNALVTIHHHVAEPSTLEEVPVGRLPLSVMQYVYPSRYCQSDRLLTMAAGEFGHLPRGYGRVLAIQQWVQQRVAFRSNTSNFTTSAVDTLIERVGVCRDFAHLMIALCRALNIPARMATGTDYGADPSLGPPDFHAYVEVYLGDRWYLFDPSGTGIPMGFVRLGTGRDAADVAFATLFGNVMASAPRVNTRVIEGPAHETPHHRPEALSTTASSVATQAAQAPDDPAQAARPPHDSPVKLLAG